MLNITSRSSRLAVVQVEEALQALRPLFPGELFEHTRVSSPGDRDLVIPLSDKSVPADFFTRDVDEAILSGTADISVHSAKDLPPVLAEGLELTALLPAKDIRDVLVTRPGDTQPLKTLGVSSGKREAFFTERYPDAVQKPLRGTIEERIEQLDRGDFDGIITAACALERLGLADRITEYLPYDPAPQQGRLAIVTRADREDLNQKIRTLCTTRNSGLVALVGCPADAALLSERARLYLDHADVVVHDRLIPDTILLSFQHKAVSVGKADGERSTMQSEIHRTLLHEAEKGKLVVRLQGGDPLIFGHLGEELQFLNDWNLRYDIITSPSAAQVAAARAASPLTHRGGGRSLTILSGKPKDQDLPDHLPPPGSGNLAIYMGSKRFKELADRLTRAGWPGDTNVIVGERLGYRDEWVHQVALQDVDKLAPQVPSVFLVGTGSWPQQDVTLFTGTSPGKFLKHGPLIHWPVVRLVPRPAEERSGFLQQHLPECSGILFTGSFSIRMFIEALAHHADTRVLAGCKLFAVSESVADALQHYGLKADAVPGHHGGFKELAADLLPEGSTLLYPCSDTMPVKQRIDALAPVGIKLIPAVFYSNRAMPPRDLPRRPFTRVIFTNALSVQTYFENHPEERDADRTWLAVGPSTLAELEKQGLQAASLVYDAPRS